MIQRIQILVHSTLIPNAIEVQIGDVPSKADGKKGGGGGGGDVELRKALFMSLGEVRWEAEKDKGFAARQLQTVELGGTLKVSIKKTHKFNGRKRNK